MKMTSVATFKHKKVLYNTRLSNIVQYGQIYKPNPLSYASMYISPNLFSHYLAYFYAGFRTNV
jgi:hypothetical protein